MQKSLIIAALLALSGVEARRSHQKHNTYLSQSVPKSNAVHSLAELNAPDSTVTEQPVAAPVAAPAAAPAAVPVETPDQIKAEVKEGE